MTDKEIQEFASRHGCKFVRLPGYGTIRNDNARGFSFSLAQRHSAGLKRQLAYQMDKFEKNPGVSPLISSPEAEKET